MTQFIKTIIPTEEYQEIKQIGDRYIVHLDREDNEDGSTYCYECIVDGTPDLEALNVELLQYKEYIAAKELQFKKLAKIQQLMKYDSSDAVNSFSINNKDMWLDAATRQQLRISIEAVLASGRDSAEKWFDGVRYEFPVTSWITMLNLLEVYASDALNVTESHKAAINALTSILEVETYDFTTGYPQKLIF